MSKKAIFDYHRAKETLAVQGVNISYGIVAKEFGITDRHIINLTKGGNGKIMCFLLEFCKKYELEIEDVITIKEE